MDGKLKPGRRCRAKRERVRRLREAGGRDPDSSCSDGEGHSPGRDAAPPPGKKAPRPAAAARAARPPRRKRRESSSQEEDIIDGFAIASFISLDRLEWSGRQGFKVGVHEQPPTPLTPSQQHEDYTRPFMVLRVSVEGGKRRNKGRGVSVKSARRLTPPTSNDFEDVTAAKCFSPASSLPGSLASPLQSTR
ncbi:putative autism susceptibility 2 protein-like [Scophthalmus maximus]|uniref:Putative autism susceptibility 2 protein-like n=1 Tax=Scophthalmus maximus TaxID=52904 RepID=A0A2U9BQS2_SCOMX|nr:putative autism susceptibility 2 protein-like [Scophthalmus maximus]